MITCLLLGSNQVNGKTNQANTVGCTQNGSCHGELISHPTESECKDCHSAISPKHPQKGQKTFTSSGQGCLKCHPKVVDYDFLHAPIAAGDCTACHDPHGNKDSHYIQNTTKLICYKCHQPMIKSTDIYQHGPVAEDKCELCHAQHGSFFPNLLKDNFAPDFFNDYQKGTYKFCFRCHKIDLLMFPKTSYNTGFRDGKKNLHFLHVNRPSRGMSCKLCHRTHAAGLPKLMAQQAIFGDWQMPINYKMTENGGSCSPGCHKAKSYNRTIKLGH